MKHMVKFSDTFIVGCKNYRKSTVEVRLLFASHPNGHLPAQSEQ